jgi:dienelactone hydrolase
MSIRRLMLLIIVAAAVLAACGGAPAAPTTLPAPAAPTLAPAAAVPATVGAATIPTLSIQPPEAPIDQPVAIRLSGFVPHQDVAIRATTVGAAFPNLSDTGIVLESVATFRTDAYGALDLDTQAPLSGSYTIVDGMGLFWSMTEKPAKPGSTSAAPAPTPPHLVNAVQYHYMLTAEVNGKQVTQATMIQDMGSASVVVKDVAENGALGQFYQPAGAGPFPAVIMLGGSAGGLPNRPPKVLAAHGYAVLSLAYFGYTSPVDKSALPYALDKIPLEYFGKAIQWLQAQPGVDPERIGITGSSAGGMAALLAGTIYPQIKTVIVFSAPTYTTDSDAGDSSFSYHGQPVPFANSSSIGAFDLAFDKAVAQGKDPLPIMPAMLARIKADPKIAAAIIPVEKINGSVLLISGVNDIQIPGTVLGELAIDRLKAHHFAFPYRHIINLGAGHLLDFPYVTRSSELEQGGGSAQANAQAAAVMWPVVLEYLAAMK